MLGIKSCEQQRGGEEAECVSDLMAFFLFHGFTWFEGSLHRLLPIQVSCLASPVMASSGDSNAVAPPARWCR